MGNKQKPEAHFKKASASGLCLILAPLSLTAVLLAGLGTYNAIKIKDDKAETDRLAAMADHLAPPPTWVKTSDIRAGEQWCSPVETTCNSVSQDYRPPAPLNYEEFNGLVQRVGMDPAKTEGDCLDDPQIASYEEFCKNEVVIDEHRHILMYGTTRTSTIPTVRYKIVDLNRE